MAYRFLLLGSLLAALALSPTALAADNLAQQAMLAESVGDWDKALQIYRHVLKSEPNNAAALTFIARAELSKGKASEAKAHLDQAVQRDPNNAQAQRLLADLLGHAGYLDEAHAHYKKLLELQPANVHARLNVTAYLATHDKLAQAVEVCRAGMTGKNIHKKLLLESGHLYLQLGMVKEANEAFKSARDTESRDSEPYQMLAITCGARNDWVSAADYAQSFSDIDLNSVNAMVPAAWAAYASGDLLEAKIRFERAVEERPDNADLRNLYALVLMDLRRFPGAAEQLMDAAKLDPKNIYIKMNGVMLALLQGKLQDGLDAATAIADEHPDLASAVSLSAYANLLNGKKETAARLAERTLKLDEADALGNVVSARLLRDDGKYEAALKHLTGTESTIGGTSAFIQCEIADVFLTKGDYRRAAEAAQFALQLSATNLQAKLLLGRALAKQKNWDGALLYLREIAARNPKDLDAKLELGEALLEKGDAVAAQLVYEAARKLAPNSPAVITGLSKAAAMQGDKKLVRQLSKEVEATRARQN